MRACRKVGIVAAEYFPAPLQSSSTRRMRRWIDSDSTLRRALVRAGYRKGQRYFTTKQITVLNRILGKP